MSGHEPGGTSVQNMHHWTQMVKNPSFQMMNFGKTGNLKKYGKTHPPQYDITKVRPQRA